MNDQSVEIHLSGQSASAMDLVGKWLTDDLFKASHAREIVISDEKESYLLLLDYPSGGDKNGEWRAFVVEKRGEGWEWIATYSYMLFRKIAAEEKS